MISYLFTKTPLVFLTQSLWRDEAFSYLLAKKNIVNIIYLTAKDFNPPLYYFLLHLWMKLFGHSEISLRLLSLVFFGGIIYVSYLFLVNIIKINFKRSFLYLGLFVLNPLLIFYAFEARMYTMFAFMVVLSFYLLFKKNWHWYVFVTVLGLYTHYFMIFAVLAQLAVVFLFEKKQPGFRKKIANILLSLIFIIPWFFFVLKQRAIINEPFWIEKVPLNLTTGFYLIFSFPKIIFNGYENIGQLIEKPLLQIILALILDFLLIIGFIKTRLEKGGKKNIFYYLFFWSILIPALIGILSYWKPIFLPRYLIFATVGLLILISYALEKIKPLERYIFIVFFIYYSLSYNQFQIKNQQKDNVRVVFNEIKHLAGKKDLLYVTNELDFFLGQYYFDENRVYIFGKNYTEIPNYVGKILIPKDKIATTLPVYPEKVFILKNNYHYDIQSLY